MEKEKGEQCLKHVETENSNWGCVCQIIHIHSVTVTGVSAQDMSRAMHPKSFVREGFPASSSCFLVSLGALGL